MVEQTPHPGPLPIWPHHPCQTRRGRSCCRVLSECKLVGWFNQYMKSPLNLVCLWLFCAVSLFAAETNSAASADHARKPGEYALGPDSLPQPGVPKGKLEGP